MRLHEKENAFRSSTHVYQLLNPACHGLTTVVCSEADWGMVEAGTGIVGRLLRAFSRWLKSDSDDVPLRQTAETVQLPEKIQPNPSGLPGATSSTLDQAPPHKQPTAFQLSARLHATAKLNIRKDRVARSRRAPRADKPAIVAPTVVRSRGETRHVWLETRERPKPAPARAATVHALKPAHARPARRHDGLPRAA